MRRLLAIVLLALLPLQFSWAAVASYAEGEVQAEHGGHVDHHHQHQADAGLQAAAEQVAGDATGSAEADCGQSHCHHCHCVGMPSLANTLSTDPATARPHALTSDTAGSHAATRPERPQWAALA